MSVCPQRITTKEQSSCPLKTLQKTCVHSKKVECFQETKAKQRCVIDTIMALQYLNNDQTVFENNNDDNKEGNLPWMVLCSLSSVVFYVHKCEVIPTTNLTPPPPVLDNQMDIAAVCDRLMWLSPLNEPDILLQTCFHRGVKYLAWQRNCWIAPEIPGRTSRNDLWLY